ncbi:MAG: MBL fold metallo-hydrolase [Saprospiraceae bacterium]|nr:MBL fold metallo-hydrolase [Saprospiraceae bacterium]
MKIQFCGAAREVTGSSHLLTLDNGFKILLDCGLYQGSAQGMSEFNPNWLFKPEEIDTLIVSHAHIDHTGRIPYLVKSGFSGPIHCTHATRSLCALMLLDGAKIQERDAEFFNKRRKSSQPHRTPLYTAHDVTACMELFTSYGYQRWFKVHDDVEVLFRDAGHILGSATVTLKIRENGRTTYLGFTGDIGRPNRPILRDPQPIPEVDYLICESTYGNKEHIQGPEETERLLSIIIDTCVKRRGKVLIPAFSLGRTQEIVYTLDQMETAGRLPRIPIYVDSPLAVDVTAVFGAHPECYDQKMHEYLLIDDNPFGFKNLKYIRDLDESKALNSSEEPCVIISAAGMLNAGRSRHHLSNSMSNSRNTILIVGYCSPGTPGGMLLNGIKEIKLFGVVKPLLARVEVMDSFSAHADRREMLHFLESQRRRQPRIFLVHGEIERQEQFRNYLAENGFNDVEIPELGQEFDL